MYLTILGCNAASPAYGRNPTAQILSIDEELFLIDCGEGTQMQMQKFSIKSNRINNIFISHLHGDHYFGLIGWLNSQSLYGRTKEVNIFCPAKIKNIIEIQLDYALSFSINYIFLSGKEEAIILESDKYCVYSFGVNHSIETWGFKFIKRSKKRILNLEKVREFNIPKYYYSKLCDGLDYTTKDGLVIKNESITNNGKLDIVYAYAADTKYDEGLIPFFKDANCLYHEATYLNAQIEKAEQRYHSTAAQAANIAKLANVKQLIIGHYSSKYQEIETHFQEAKCIFASVRCAVEGTSYTIE
jgi:ribonuclease Z